MALLVAGNKWFRPKSSLRLMDAETEDWGVGNQATMTTTKKIKAQIVKQMHEQVVEEMGNS